MVLQLASYLFVKMQFLKRKIKTDYDISKIICHNICKIWIDKGYPMVACFVYKNILYFACNLKKKNPFLHAESILTYNILKLHGVYSGSEIIKNSKIIIGTQPCLFCSGLMKYYDIKSYINLSKPNCYISNTRYVGFLKEFFKRKRNEKLTPSSN